MLDKQQRIEANGRGRVVQWAFDPKSGPKLQQAFSDSFAAAAGDVRGILAEIYARPDDVGQAW